MESIFNDKRQVFPPGFMWGVATAALQIEGSKGRGPCQWDVFAAPVDESTPGEACDHVTYFQEDLELLRRLNAGAYRFSVSWPRVVPDGKGKPDPEGLAFYERLIDGLLDRKIEPFPTLFYDDLPLFFHNRRGWLYQDTALWFADFAAACAERFGDRINFWTTLNDPLGVAVGGYLLGVRPPGLKNVNFAFTALENLLFAHTQAASVLQELCGKKAKVGIAVALHRLETAQAPRADKKFARRAEALWNEAVLEFLSTGKLPEELSGFAAAPGSTAATSPTAPMPLKPLDFVGVNYYGALSVKPGPGGFPVPAEPKTGKAAAAREAPCGHPQGLKDLLLGLKERYNPPAVFVTENGVSVSEYTDKEGRLHDEKRIEYLRDHVRAVFEARAAGVPVQGYFVWSLLDGFEFELGYNAPFGLVAVGEKAFRRKPKESYEFTSRLFELGELPE